MRHTCSDSYYTNNKLRDNHSRTSNNEDRSPTKSLDEIKRHRRGANVAQGGDQNDEERILNGAKTLEEDRAKVQDKIDTGQLLHHLHKYAW